MFKVNYRNTRTRCEIYSKLTIDIFHILFCVSIVNCEQVNDGWIIVRNRQVIVTAICSTTIKLLTHFSPVSHFYTP